MSFRIRSKSYATVITGFSAAISCAHAQGTGNTVFHSTPITIQGSTQVNVTAINTAGVYIGAVVIGNTLLGFIQDGTSFTPIQGECGAAGQCLGYPTGINARGAVTGFVYGGRSGGFVWKDGAFVANDFFPINSQASPLVGPFINNRGRIAFNAGGDPSYMAYAGEPSAPSVVGGFGLNPNGAFVTGFSNTGLVVGVGSPPGASGQYVHFVGRNGVFDDLPFSNANSAYTTLINDNNEVAYAIGSTAVVYSNGTFTDVPLPSQATGPTVQALNNAGRLAGTYLDSSTNTQAVFLYNGATVSTFGAYPASDQLHVSINDGHTLIVNDVESHSGPGVSFLVKCKGPGC